MNTFITDNLPDSVAVSQPRNSPVPYTIYNLTGDPGVNIHIYRSAIIGADRLLCLAPSKSVSLDELLENSDDNTQFKAEEIVEGTMINLFWDERIGWEIATKKGVSCNYFYFRNQYQGNGEQKTFRQMFLDAFTQKPNVLADLELLAHLDKTCCYTFVLQHPLNHIVLNVEEPTVYLVYMHKLGELMSYSYAPNCEELHTYFLNAGVKFPVSCDNVFDKSLFATKYIDISTRVTKAPGYMITDLKSGLRASIENPEYQSLKTLRGNHPNMFFHYLMLRKSKDVERFIGQFPQYSQLFQGFNTRFSDYVSMIYQLYADVFITKTKDIKTIEDKKALFFINRIHYAIYLPILKRSKMKITRQIVDAFLDSKEYMMPI
jgi:hypothetical protein